MTTTLEPHIDARIMELHHDKHQGYVDGANNALDNLEGMRDRFLRADLDRWRAVILSQRRTPLPIFETSGRIESRREDGQSACSVRP